MGVAVAWSHPLLDLLYCGWGPDVDWPVQLLWPVSGRGFGQPWVPWSDWGATVVLATGFLACVLARPARRWCAAATLAVLAVYVGIRGALLWLQ